MIDYRKELEELDGPFTKLGLIKKKIDEKKRLSDNELNAGIFIKESEEDKSNSIPVEHRIRNLQIEKTSFLVPIDMLIEVSKRNYQLFEKVLSDPIIEESGQKEKLEKLKSEFKKHIDELEKV